MAIVAHTHPFVIGVDTHARSHAISILASPNGEVIDDAQFPATAAGLTRAVAWAGRRTDGDLDALWVIEGTGTYGARLARAAVAGALLATLQLALTDPELVDDAAIDHHAEQILRMLGTPYDEGHALAHAPLPIAELPEPR